MKNLLLDERPLIILPSLAVKFGINEAIIIQQFHYWLQRSTNIKEGHKWIYNSYEEWAKQFPFWSLSTLKRVILKLEREEVLITGNYNKIKIDKTKWYRLNYSKLATGQSDTFDEVNLTQSTGQSDTMQEVNLTPPITIEYTKSTSKSTKEHYVEIVYYLNSIAGTSYKPSSKRTRSLINARLNEGFSVNDFKKVIKNKSDDWLKDKKMNKYLRPETLFGTKFESYLNERGERNAKIEHDLSHKDITNANDDELPF